MAPRRGGASPIWLIGDPVAHSLSPVFQNAGFEELGAPFRYEVRRTPVEELELVVNALRNGEVRGANVTLPHKEAVIPYLDRLSHTAARARAVNTLVPTVYGIEGHNTDVSGLRRMLLEWLDGASVKTACILGAGGTTRAAIVALDQLGCGRVGVVNRTIEKAAELVVGVSGDVEAELSAWALEPICEGRLPEVVAEAELIIHATSLGVGAARGSAAYRQATDQWELLPWPAWAGAKVVDVCYGRGRTPFLDVADSFGVRGIDGLDMLLYQGLDAFVLWTSRNPPEAVMRRALRAAVGLAPG